MTPVLATEGKPRGNGKQVKQLHCTTKGQEMTCSVLVDGGTRCPHPVIDGDVCREHRMWKRGRSGHMGFNLIVRDEEQFLEACLLNIRPLADEIVVTDTGSVDRTREIACKYADKVLDHPWQDSFSEARNYSLQFSRSDWITWIDADETVMPVGMEEYQRLRQQDPGANTLFCRMLSELPGGRASRHFLPKVFRRGTAHFENIVHNQLIHDGRVTRTGISFWHKGYNLDAATMDKKRQRTERLLRMQIADDAKDGFALMNLARTLMTSGQYAESYQVCKRGLSPDFDGEMVPSVREMLLYNFVTCALHYQHVRKAEAALWEILTMNPHNLDALYSFGYTCMRQQKWAEAVQWFKRYLEERKFQEGREYFDLLIQDFFEARAEANCLLGECFMRMQKFEDAAWAYEAAVKLNPDISVAWKNLVICYAEQGKREQEQMTLEHIQAQGFADADVWTEMAWRRRGG